MEAQELLKSRRSVRKFKDEKVSKELMTEILELSRWAPSWANFQIARYTIIDNGDMISDIADNCVKGFVYNINTLKQAKGVMVLSYVLGKSGSLGEKVDATVMSDEEIAKTKAWESFDAGIACQQFCLAAHAKGVGTCIMGVIDNDSIAQVINLPEGETVAALIVYGFEEGGPTEAPKRKEVEKIARFID